VEWFNVLPLNIPIQKGQSQSGEQQN